MNWLKKLIINIFGGTPAIVEGQIYSQTHTRIGNKKTIIIKKYRVIKVEGHVITMASCSDGSEIMFHDAYLVSRFKLEE